MFTIIKNSLWAQDCCKMPIFYGLAVFAFLKWNFYISLWRKIEFAGKSNYIVCGWWCLCFFLEWFLCLCAFSYSVLPPQHIFWLIPSEYILLWFYGLQLIILIEVIFFLHIHADSSKLIGSSVVLYVLIYETVWFVWEREDKTTPTISIELFMHFSKVSLVT